ncbi:hypothetical protein MLD52_19390 [Puniceicoccaceae bacterium K14]|nr:hypothetical protein [Puniceicoccaceae bacterium K14]
MKKWSWILWLQEIDGRRVKAILNLFYGFLGAVLFHAVLFWAILLVRPWESEATFDQAERLSVEVLYDVSEQMALFDPRPMLLPTEWNVANAGSLGDIVREELPIFEDYEYRFAKEEGGFVTSYGNSWGRSMELRDVQLAFDFPQLDQLGTSVVEQAKPRNSQLVVRLRKPSTGELLHEAIIQQQDVSDLSSRWPGWAPVMYFVTVADSFFMQGATVLESSGYQELDLILQDMAKNGLENRGFWRDGLYLMEVGL